MKGHFMINRLTEYDEIKTLADAMADVVKPQRIYLFGSFAKTSFLISKSTLSSRLS